ncbi:serine/threonine-protein kinase PAK 3-like protein [Aphelenchoides avenae]|nr:serine/threonine-protein kinase PAK 3-like protein [Aphelenchus avenae]
MEIALELMDMRDLGGLVKEVNLGEEELAYIGRETLHGIAYMHSKDFVHGDVKPGNVLAHSDGSVKLGDFDHSNKVEDFGYGGTEGYMAPEVVERKQCGTALDIFSFGRLVAELKRAELQKGRSDMLSRDEAFRECSPLLQDFLAHCLNEDPTERWTAEDLLKHPFLAKAERGAEKFSLSVEELALKRKLAPIQKKLQEMEMRKLNLGIDEFSFV